MPVDKPRFRVSAVDLSEADERVLKVFLRFVGDTPNSIWEWSIGEDCDLLLVGGELPRPLHADDFSELLRKVEAGNSRPRTTGSLAMADAIAAKPPETPAGKPVEEPVEKPAGKIPENTPPASPHTRPAPTPAAVEMVRPAHPERSGRYRLVRWPKSEFLRGRARATRFLSFLASGHLTVQQLCTLSGADRETCMALLDALEAAGYLDVKQAEAAEDNKSPLAAVPPRLEAVVVSARPAAAAGALAVRSMPSVPRVAPRAQAAALPTGLFGRLRRQLGLG
jgi:hypothetical protein